MVKQNKKRKNKNMLEIVSKKSFVKKMKSDLLIEKDKLLNRCAAVGASSSGEIDMSGDETDEIQANILVNINNTLQKRLVNQLNQINDALKRIKDNTYGMCQDCNENIPEKRLLLNPYFTTCIACAEDREMENKQRGK